MEKQKAEVMAAKWRRTRERMSSSSEEEDKSDTRDNTDLDQTNANTYYNFEGECAGSYK